LREDIKMDTSEIFRIVRENRKHEFQEALERAVWDDRKEFLLHISAQMGRDEMVEMLLKRGADPNQKFGDDDSTPLHAAVGGWPGTLYHNPTCEERFRVLKVLLDAGANVHAKLSAAKGSRFAPLHSLAIGGSGDCKAARLLCDYGADPNAEDRFGRPPIFYARTHCARQNKPLLKELTRLARAHCAGASAMKRDWWQRLKALILPSASLAADEDRSDWTLDDYARAIMRRVTNATPGQASGLQAHRQYIRRLGQEIYDRRGLRAMQQVCHEVHSAMGPGPCSDLNRIWDGVGGWRR
jgi:hypothetical protein